MPRCAQTCDTVRQHVHAITFYHVSRSAGVCCGVPRRTAAYVGRSS
jgi:hypothetical protein